MKAGAAPPPHRGARLTRSLVVPAFFPSSIVSEQALVASLDVIARETPAIEVFEFFLEGEFSQSVADVLQRLGKRSIFLAAVKAKRAHLNLAATDRIERERAVTEVIRCLDIARAYQSEAVVINTGFRPEDSADTELALRGLAASLDAILSHAETGGPRLDIFMETGAMNQSSHELLGSTTQALALLDDLRDAHSNIFLTLDTSHLRQLGEDPLASIARARRVSKHVHLANCLLSDPASPLYGDKHPEFGVAGGELSVAGIRKVFETLNDIFAGDEVTVGMEIICRQPDERAYYQQSRQTLDWFLGNGNVTMPPTQSEADRALHQLR